MKINRIFGLASAIAFLATASCSNDVIDPNKNNGSLNTDGGSGTFLSLDFQMPSGPYQGTRSSTEPGGGSSAGTEIGTDAESFVSDALIVLAASEAKPDKNIEKFGFIVAGEVPGNRIASAGTTSDGNKRFRATADIQKENINKLYGIYGDDKVPDVYVFVFCNPTSELLNMFDGDNTKFGSADWIDPNPENKKAICEVFQSKDGTQNKNVGIWAPNSFLMNNVSLVTRGLPKKLLHWEKYSTVDSVFHLSNKNNDFEDPRDNVDNSSDNNRGVIYVERSVARFDFKDGSKDGNGGTNNNTYTVLYNVGETGDFLNGQNGTQKQPIVDVQIQKMCLVNMCNKFYYLPRTSPDGQLNGSVICGAEVPWARENGEYSGGNYVVGPYATQFGGNAIMTDFSTYFNFPFFEDNGSFNNEIMSSSRWDVVKVEDVLKGAKDNYVGSEKDENGKTIESFDHSYHVWRYVTENVIPGPEDNQMNGISTGVVFKAKLVGGMLKNINYYEEYWDKGAISNLSSCLNNMPFTYTADPAKPEEKDHPGLTGLSGANNDDVSPDMIDPILYYIGGRLYMGWRHLRQAAIQASVTVNSSNGNLEINRSNSLYKAVFGDGPIPSYKIGGKETYMKYIKPDGTSEDIVDDLWIHAISGSEAYAGYLESADYAWSQWTLNGKEVGDDATGGQSNDLLAKMRAKVVGAGITIFQSSRDKDMATPDNPEGAGYYCYYYYWNRHNDNGLDGIMGPMEFDVVRNNVYKLSVENIARLGHPRIPENDPNHPTPDTPDESEKIYLDVRLEVVPWAVRVNHIKF